MTRTERLGCVALVIGIVVADQLTKNWAVDALANKPVNLIGSHVQFHLSRNAGSAFSFLTGFTPLLACIAIGVLVALFWKMRTTNDVLTVISLSLIAGGALGNLADRIFRSPSVFHGEVVDFIRVGWWPVFNVADSAITVGVVVLFAASIKKEFTHDRS